VVYFTRSGNVVCGAALMNNRRTRQFLLYGVLAIGFLLPVVTSIGILFGRFRLHDATQTRLLFRVIYQVAGLLSLYFALRYQGRKLKDLGFSIGTWLRDVGHGFGLFLGVLLLSVALYFGLIAFIPWLRGALRPTYDAAALFGTRVTALTVLWAVALNPFHEELLVRAFLITEMEALYHSTLLAVLVSVSLQTSYHLYQGPQAALSHVPTFLVFSWYYVRTRRILPVILAHLLLDASALAIYATHL
jgi:membrane protease YdiL (CAAX protease family)